MRTERERQVVMDVFEAMNSVLKSCQGEALKSPGRLQEISHVIRDVLKKKVRRRDRQRQHDISSIVIQPLNFIKAEII